MPLKMKSPSGIKNKVAVEGDVLFTAICNLTPDEIDSYVDTNITSMQDIRDTIKLLLKHTCSLQGGVQLT